MPAPTTRAADAITEPQMKKMMALMNEHGLAERGARLSYTAAVIDREIETARDLTKAEAGAVIEALEAMNATEQDGHF